MSSNNKFTLLSPLVSKTDGYYYKSKIVPAVKKAERGLVLSAFNYTSQKPISARKDPTDFGRHLTHLNRSLEQLHRNLNYSSEITEWKQFYKFPSVAQVKTYTAELKRELGEAESPFVVNANTKSVGEYFDRIVSLFSDERCMISFLNGTTGVGKTTFLKYFTKTKKHSFLMKRAVLSRVKFRDIEALYDARATRDLRILNSVFSTHVIDCLVRDVIDSYRFCSSAEYNFDAKTKDDFEYIFSRIEQYCHAKFPKTAIEKLIELVDGNEDIITELDQEFKRKIISIAHQREIRFCIVLDGFDAIRPEEIQLFGDNKQGDFFKCLSAVIKESFEIDTPEGRVINKLNKAIIIAARPTTIFQLKVEVQDEVDFDHVFSHEVYVIGSDLYGIIENRIRLFYMKKTKVLAPPQDLIDIIKDCIAKVIDVLYEAHSPALEKGRFIDLFNHNIREKLVFVRSVIQYMIGKVETAYVGSRLFARTSGLFSITEFKELLSQEPQELGIDLYEVQKLLILPHDGRFKNHFLYNTDEELVPASPKGPFDNIFNYLKFPSRHGYEKARDEGWPVSRDPILSKFLILHFLSKRPNQVATVTTIEEWFEEEFVHLRLDYLDLKLLIRGGFIEVRRISASPHAFLTRKGEFLIKELISSEIYLEHVVLNSRLPLYIADMIISPTSPERRIWGRISIVNVLIFLMYLRQVSEEICTSRDLELPTLINHIYEGVKKSFPGVIVEGLREEGGSYGIVLANELNRIEKISRVR